MPIALEPTIKALPVRKRAPHVIGPTNKEPQRPSSELPADVIANARATPIVKFDAKKHLCYSPPKKLYTMEEFGYGGQGISEIAGSEPFSMFNEEAVEQCRREIFSESVLETCQYSSTFTAHMVRGMSKEQAPFIHAFWSSPEVLKIVSENAGIDLVPAFDYEVANINFFFGDENDYGTAVQDQNKDQVGFSWHYDSFPFVCVTMLSDCSTMIGGETAVKKGNGEIIKVRGPNMGTGVVLQGRYIQHAALKAFGKERISMVTAFRPKNPFVRDELILTGSIAISNQSEILYDYSQYRAVVLAERFKEHARRLTEARDKGENYDVDAAKEFIREQQEMLEATMAELSFGPKAIQLPKKKALQL